MQAMPMFSQIGSGALPVDQLAQLRPACATCGRRTRWPFAGRNWKRGCGNCRDPSLGASHDDALWLDLRCLEEREESAFIAQLKGHTA